MKDFKGNVVSKMKHTLSHLLMSSVFTTTSAKSVRFL